MIIHKYLSLISVSTGNDSSPESSKKRSRKSQPQRVVRPQDMTATSHLEDHEILVTPEQNTGTVTLQS